MKYGKEIGAGAGLVVLLAGIVLWVHSTMSHIDTSGAKPPPTFTQADYQKRIEAIQNTTGMPDGVKQAMIARVKSEMNSGTALPPGGPQSAKSAP